MQKAIDSSSHYPSSAGSWSRMRLREKRYELYPRTKAMEMGEPQPSPVPRLTL